jgi:curved DNA-binding protein CbpA
VRIPLDYYQILSVPTVATMGQIQQAYADRNLQQFRHEYTALVIESRRKLLKEAYEVLAHPTERSQYDAAQMADNLHFTKGDNPLVNLDVDNDRILGGLLILSEIGEYEKVLSISWPLIGSDQALAQITDSADLEETRIALNLTAALALLELGRERWRQNEPGDGCTALETGIKLLSQQDIFPSLQAEIQKELHKFRPQYILSLLTNSDHSAASRQQVLSLLQELVEGCSSKQGYMTYGMTQDGFIAYIDQIRRHLTTTEQQSLFEGPAIRLGDPVFTYLLVYAMVARGFHYRMPELIYRANQLLLQNLSRLQDIFIEQALCYLLLGQQAEANSALRRSRDQETLGYIRKNSPTDQDLIQGLCRYSELWFQSQVYPHFLDLNQQQASLGQYFEDPQVQVYLDHLPQPEPLVPDEIITVQPIFNQVPTTASLSNYRGSVPLISSIGITEPIKTREISGDLPQAERVGYPEPENNQESSPDNVVPFERPLKKREPIANNVVELDGTNNRSPLGQLNSTAGGQLTAIQGKELTRRPKTLAIARRHRYDLRFLLRLMTISLASLIGVFTVVLMVNNTTKWFRQAPVATTKPTSRIALPAVPLVSALPATVAISPSPTLSVPLNKPVTQITPDTAQELIETWLQAKANSLSKQHDLPPLSRVLVEPALARAQQRAQATAGDGSYWQYRHQVNQVRVQASLPNQLESKTIDALVNESADYFDRNDQRNSSRSYNKKLHVQYELFNKNGQWFIKDMTIIQ